MQNQYSSDGNGFMPLRLQDYERTQEFPPHIYQILNPNKPIPFTEIMCRLLHVCMIEVGFVPIVENEPEFEVDTLCDMTMEETTPKLVRCLQRIIDSVGNLHNVNYTAIVLEKEGMKTTPFLKEETCSSNELSFLDITENSKYNINEENSGSSISVASKESGDGSTLITLNIANEDQTNDETFTSASGMSIVPHKTERKKVYSEKVYVSVIHDGHFMYAIANGRSFHQNIQISIPQYINSKNIDILPVSAKLEDYWKLMSFSAIRFVDDVKLRFCFPIMDEMNAFSFDIRSISWLPAEIIMEIAKRCTPVALFRLRSTCTEIRNILSDSNEQLWKTMLKRDFPQFNVENLKSDTSLNKFFKKYKEMWNFTYRRPLRRVGQRVFPYYLMSFFRI